MIFGKFVIVISTKVNLLYLLQMRRCLIHLIKQKCSISKNSNLFFFSWASLHARLNNHRKSKSYKKKKRKRMKRIQESYLLRSHRKKVSINSSLTAIQIIVQRKAFLRKRNAECCSARKETVDKDILKTSRTVDKKSGKLLEKQVDLPQEY